MGLDLTDLRATFAGRLLEDADAVAPFLTDWRRKWTGRALAVAQPDTAEGVAAVLRWCHAHRVAVVPQGGNTGLSGGATPAVEGRSLVLSTARLQRIRALDPVGQTITVEAGVTLQQVQDAARDAGRLFPLSLAAQGTCTIGGNLATNAGGVQVLRYGNARELCLGLEVVTAEGELWNGLRPLRKDNTGYALRDLYIGSEGTLGVITAAVLKLFPLPAAQGVAFVAVPSPAAALALLSLAQQRLAADLTAFELISETCLQLVEKHVDAARRPLAEPSPWYVLLEVSSAQGESAAAEAIEALLEVALEAGHASDAALSASVAQFRSLWALREDISESQGAEGPTIKHDIALPITRIPDFIDRTDAALARHFPGLRLVVFGHLGDGNLHYNVSPPAGGMAKADFLALEAPINRLVHDAVDAAGGSISAEHGLGVLRRDEAARYKSAVEQRLMLAVKQALDPLNLMNPGKLLGTPDTISPHTTETR
ncbi:MAG: FAD-binding oxidoreductase [Sphaerotilus natans subsp. sulfidivorans]|uniref:FAD-binding oxidoreductase n=1 Tax=Sphaerotilus sulfidivorans TaxID=639200 RepID=UPI0023530900|nr:FAD-binding oxidoreductase [Sphaerotilus sulfidivorans]MCK6401681.1 FAD-binding oxidoreductase [Sphaerotilus sulfidivorans]